MQVKAESQGRKTGKVTQVGEGDTGGNSSDFHSAGGRASDPESWGVQGSRGPSPSAVSAFPANVCLQVLAAGPQMGGALGQ